MAICFHANTNIPLTVFVFQDLGAVNTTESKIVMVQGVRLFSGLLARSIEG
jgi:hypothetical protein